MSAEIQIDGARAFHLLGEAMLERGADYIYPLAEMGACVYTDDSQPSCMVGLALYRAGVTVPELEAMDIEGIGGIDLVTLPERVYLTPTARKVMNAAQQCQDTGETWLDALYAAELMYEHCIR